MLNFEPCLCLPWQGQTKWFCGPHVSHGPDVPHSCSRPIRHVCHLAPSPGKQIFMDNLFGLPCPLASGCSQSVKSVSWRREARESNIRVLISFVPFCCLMKCSFILLPKFITPVGILFSIPSATLFSCHSCSASLALLGLLPDNPRCHTLCLTCLFQFCWSFWLWPWHCLTLLSYTQRDHVLYQVCDGYRSIPGSFMIHEDVFRKLEWEPKIKICFCSFIWVRSHLIASLSKPSFFTVQTTKNSLWANANYLFWL